ncbi:thioesterase II family protein [Methylocucumis oryzae]|uniref:thioesterase II family protein n=1 Tax=Methylocucumis oryzae TaxID=1632867 RepID=UPI00069856A6|nr:alpha/beta fold hydrolase [Methylocucumis oryzae]
MELYAFPFAGGGEHCYRELEPYLTHATLKTQALPGRGRLLNKPCLRRLDELLDFLLAGIAFDLHKPYAFFGHSMGAFIAYMLTRKIIAYHLPAPKLLICSGRKAPTIIDADPKHVYPTSAFRAMLQELGGIPELVWQDEDLMALFEPIIRADFELIETTYYQTGAPIELPIHLLLGRQDLISSVDAYAWQQETTLPLTVSYFSGGHFYFQQDWQSLANKINSILATC